MESGLVYDNCPAQPPKKRKPEYEVQNREMNNFEFGNQRQAEMNGFVDSPKTEKVESQDSPLDFSCKNGTDSSSSPLSDPLYSKPGPSLRPLSPNFSQNDNLPQTWKPVGRFPDSPNQYQEKLPPEFNGFSEVSPANRRPETERNLAAICKPQPTKVPTNGDSVHWMGENGVGNPPMSLMAKYMQGCPKRIDASTSLRLGMNGLNSQMNSFSHLSSDSFHRRPYSRFPSYGISLASRQTNGSSAFAFGLMGSAADKKFSKNGRPFKVLENEILNYDPATIYPYINPVSFHPPRMVETSPQLSPVIPSQPRNDNHDIAPTQELSLNSNDSGSLEGEQDCQNDYSDDSQLSNAHQDGQQPDSCQGSRRRGQKFPDEKKDAAYFEKRRKNNLAAKRSRDARRRKEDEMALRAKNFLEANKNLQYELYTKTQACLLLEEENEHLKRTTYAQISQIENLQNEIANLKRGLRLNGAMNSRESSKKVNVENHGL